MTLESEPVPVTSCERLPATLSFLIDSAKSPECYSIFLKTMLIIWIKLAFAVFWLTGLVLAMWM